MKPTIVNLADVPADSYQQGRFGSTDWPVDALIRHERISTVLTRLDPGQVSSPYHCHHAGEELFIVVSGRGTVRYGGEFLPLRVGDYVICPPGRGSAHQIINDSAEPLTYWAISTIVPLEVCEYPDSGKTMVVVANAGDGKRLGRVFRDADTVPYWEGET
jgi:uncharacterized cupin superfamily protein